MHEAKIANSDELISTYFVNLFFFFFFFIYVFYYYHTVYKDLHKSIQYNL